MNLCWPPIAITVCPRKEANEVNLRSVIVTSRTMGVRLPILKPLAIGTF